MFDFGSLPPEVNSGRMYSGAGAGPLLAAAEAWDALAFELGSAAAGYGSTITELTNAPWLGPTSLAMAAAVAPYVEWMRTTAAEAEQTAIQARAAVAAYEAAFAMTVPPPVVAANRALLMALIATNFFGQNTGAIMATEALYAEMWAQDAAAMYGYAGAAATASQVTPFSPAPQTTNQDEGSSQANALAKAAAAPAGQAATVVQNAVTASPTTSAQTAATTTSATTATSTSTAATTSTVGTTTSTSSWLSWLPAPFGTGPALTTANYTTILKQTLTGYFPLGLAQFGASMQQQLTFGIGTTAGSGGAWYPTPQFAGVGHGGGAVSAGLGHAKTIGRLSVPSNWQAAAPAVDSNLVNLEELHLEELEEEELIRLELENPQLAGAIHAASRSVHAAAAAGAGVGPGSNGLLGGVPMGASSGGRGSGFVVRYGFRHAVMARPPSAG